MKINPMFLKDFYKVGHIDQYPEGTQLVFSNFTPRKSRMENVNYSILFGLRYFVKKYLLDGFNEFFSKPHGVVESEYNNFMKETLGIDKFHNHISSLAKLGYLPIAIHALPEGSIVPEGCPALVVYNTHPDFFWLTNALETIMSCTLWGACTSATIANEYRKLLDYYAKETSDNEWFVDYQAHDFSFRGMYGLEAAMISGAAHLNYFKGTDTIPAILFNNEYYGKPVSSGTSVPATEHSVMSAGGKETELETYRRLITKVYPKGIVSIVSDTWDLWKVISEILPTLKNEIMLREGKVVIRPDSGDPVEIICGKNNGVNDFSDKGVIECLWDIFGGTINSKGYKELDSHIGAIYGDSITLERCKKICENLKQKGFSSTNIVFGVGSYTYQHNTRDTLGWAMKATYCEINGVGHSITKDPVTDCGIKKSHSGLLKVIKGSSGHYQLIQNTTWENFNSNDNQLKLFFKNGELM